MPASFVPASLVPASVFCGLRAAIIDLDGTMLDTVPDFHVAINRMREELDLAPISEHSVKLLVGKGSENLIRSVLALDLDAAGIAAHYDAALASYQRHYLLINGDFSTLYPGVLAGLDALQARCGLDTATLQAELMTLELDNQLARLPGGLFQRLNRV